MYDLIFHLYGFFCLFFSSNYFNFKLHFEIPRKHFSGKIMFQSGIWKPLMSSQFLLKTRIHSSRMCTAWCSGCLSCHACPPAMHTPLPAMNAHPLATHAPPKSHMPLQPCMPCHAMHAPQTPATHAAPVTHALPPPVYKQTPVKT